MTSKEIHNWTQAYGTSEDAHRLLQATPVNTSTQDVVVFYLMRPLELGTVMVEQPFKFTMFLPDQLVTHALTLVKKHLKKETFDIWFIRATIGAVLYVWIFSFIMYWLSVWIMKPIVEFTQKIEINIE